MDFLLSDFDAFFTEHRCCGDLDSGVEQLAADLELVWMACSCGAVLRRELVAAEGRES